MLHYGCSVDFEEEEQMSILFDYDRDSDDALVSLQIRMTNLLQEPLSFNLGICSSYIGTYDERKCKTYKNIDTYIIPNKCACLIIIPF